MATLDDFTIEEVTDDGDDYINEQRRLEGQIKVPSVQVPESLISDDALPGPTELDIHKLQAPSIPTTVPRRITRPRPPRITQPAAPVNKSGTAFEYIFGRPPQPIKEGYSTSSGIAVGHGRPRPPRILTPEEQRRERRALVLAENKGIYGGFERGLASGAANVEQTIGGALQLASGLFDFLGKQDIASPTGAQNTTDSILRRAGDWLVNASAQDAADVARSLQILQQQQQGGESILAAGARNVTEIATSAAPILAGALGGVGVPMFALQEMANARARGVTDPVKLALQGAKGATYGKAFGAASAVGGLGKRILAQGAVGGTQAILDPALNEMIEKPKLTGLEGGFSSRPAYVATGGPSPGGSMLPDPMADPEIARLRNLPANRINWAQVSEGAATNIIMDLVMPGGLRGARKSTFTKVADALRSRGVEVPEGANAKQIMDLAREYMQPLTTGVGEGSEVVQIRPTQTPPARPYPRKVGDVLAGVTSEPSPAIGSVLEPQRGSAATIGQAQGEVPFVADYVRGLDSETIRAELMDAGVKFPPSTPRQELERLLIEAEQGRMSRGLQDPGYTDPFYARGVQTKLEDQYRGYQEGLIEPPELRPTPRGKTLGDTSGANYAPPSFRPREPRVRGDVSEPTTGDFGEALESVKIKGVPGARRKIPLTEPEITGEGGAIYPIEGPSPVGFANQPRGMDKSGLQDIYDPSSPTLNKERPVSQRVGQRTYINPILEPEAWRQFLGNIRRMKSPPSENKRVIYDQEARDFVEVPKPGENKFSARYFPGSGGRQGTLYATGNVVNAITGDKSYGGMRGSTGVSVPIEKLKGYYRDNVETLPPGEKQFIEAAIEEANTLGSTTIPIVITDSGLPPRVGETKTTARHESIHAAQPLEQQGYYKTASGGYLPPEGRRAQLQADLASEYDKLAPSMLARSIEQSPMYGRNYRQIGMGRFLATEAPAFIASGDAKRIGLTIEEGDKFFRKYLDDVYEKGGFPALMEFIENSRPAPKYARMMQDKLYEAIDAERQGYVPGGKVSGELKSPVDERGQVLSANPIFDPQAWKSYGRPVIDFIKSRFEKNPDTDPGRLFVRRPTGRSDAENAGLTQAQIKASGVEEFLIQNPDATLAAITKHIEENSPKFSTTSTLRESDISLGPASNQKENITNWTNAEGGSTPAFRSQTEDRTTLEGDDARLINTLELLEGGKKLKAGGMDAAMDSVLASAAEAGKDGVLFPTEPGTRDKLADLAAKRTGRQIEIRTVDLGDGVKAEMLYVPTQPPPEARTGMEQARPEVTTASVEPITGTALQDKLARLRAAATQAPRIEDTGRVERAGEMKPVETIPGQENVAGLKMAASQAPTSLVEERVPTAQPEEAPRTTEDFLAKLRSMKPIEEGGTKTYSNPIFDPEAYRRYLPKGDFFGSRWHGRQGGAREEGGVPGDDTLPEEANEEVTTGKTTSQMESQEIIDRAVAESQQTLPEIEAAYGKAKTERTTARNRLKELEIQAKRKDLTYEQRETIAEEIRQAELDRQRTLVEANRQFKRYKPEAAKAKAARIQAEQIAENEPKIEAAKKRLAEPDTSYRLDPNIPWIEEVLNVKIAKPFYHAALDAAVASNYVLNPDIPVTRQMLDMADRIPLSQFDEILERNGYSIDRLFKDIEETASKAGRYLNLPSQISRALNKMVRRNPELAALAAKFEKERLPNIRQLNALFRERNNWDRATTIYQGALVSALETAQKNLVSAQMVVGMDTLGQLFDSAVQGTLGPMGGNKQVLSPVLAVRPMINFYGELFGTLAGKGVFGREKTNVGKLAEKVADAFPEEAGRPLFDILNSDIETAVQTSDTLTRYKQQAEALPDSNPKKAKLQEAIAAAEKRYKASQTLVTKAFIGGEKVTHALGWANYGQERIVRRAVFEAKLRRYATEAGIDLDSVFSDTSNLAKKTALRKQIEGMKPEDPGYADLKEKLTKMEENYTKAPELPSDIVSRAAQETLRLTFGRRPAKGSTGDFINKALRGKWGFFVKVGAMPFPNFWLHNFIKFQYEHSPLGLLSIASPETRANIAKGDMGAIFKPLMGAAIYGMAAEVTRELYDSKGSKDIPGEEGTLEKVPRKATGWAARTMGLKRGEKWYELNWGGRNIDARFLPIGPALFLADFQERSRRGLSAYTAKDVMDAMGLGTKNMENFGSMVEDTVVALRDAASSASSDKAGRAAGEYFGAIAAGLLTPLKTYIDTPAQFFSEAERKYRDTKTQGEGWASFTDAFRAQLQDRIPWWREKLPEKESPTRKATPERQAPLARGLGGISIVEPRNFIESEATLLGLTPRDIVPHTGDAKVDRAIDQQMGLYLEGASEQLHNNPTYNALPAERRRQVLIDIVLPGLWPGAQSYALAMNPDIAVQKQIKSAFTKEALGVENRRRRSEGKPSIQDEVKQKVRQSQAGRPSPTPPQ